LKAKLLFTYMRNYFIAKLSEINRRMAIHEGNASRRLANEAVAILLLPSSDVPGKYKKDFLELRRLIEATIKKLPAPGLTPSKLGRIQNRTASKYIQMLLSIEDYINDD